MSVGDVQKLTPRQKEILRLLLNGFDAKSAGRELGISVHTVNEHLREARRQLGVSSSREAARVLRQVESAPPKSLGANRLGVVDPISRRFFADQPSPNRRLVYVGVLLMVLIAAAGIALSIANGGPSSRPGKGIPTIMASKPKAEQNPSPYQSRDVPVSAFERVEVSGPFKVGVVVSAEPAKVSLEGPPALLADTIATVEGDTLRVRFREGATWSWNPGSGVNVFISTPDLNSINLEGAGDIEVVGVRGPMFSAATDGAGSIVARGLDVGHVQLATRGAGGITVEGSAREGTYVVGGSGSIDAKRMRVKSASIAIDGAGSTYADVSSTANVSVSGGGRAELVGGARCIKQPANSPRIECR